jgi:hypothetical protein
VIKQIVEYINSKGNFKTEPTIIENALWFYVASILGTLRVRILIDNELKPLNYYGITIASSSAGKSFAYEQIRKMFNIDEEKLYKFILNSYKKNTINPIMIGENELSDYIPRSTTNIEGTAEGLYIVCYAINRSDFGSINIMNEEILDIVKDSNLDRLKELYDGNFNAKVIKSDINQNLYNLHVNMLVFGSPIAIKKDKTVYNKFSSQLGSGMYRRSFIYYLEPQKIELNTNRIDINKPTFIDNLKNFIKNNKDNVDITVYLSKEAEDYTYQIKSELIEFVNENLDDDRYSAELGSYQKIVKLAGLHSILTKGVDYIDIESLEYAYDFYKKCRSTVGALFNTIPQHKRYYNIIQKYPNITKSEIFEKDIFDLKSWNEDIAMTKEFAYRDGKRLIESGTAIKKYRVDPLPKTDINKIIVSVPTKENDKAEKTVNYVSAYMSFFAKEDNKSIERLVQSNKVSNFLLTHFVDGKRKKNNSEDEINAIGIDIDGGAKLDDIKQFFNDINITYLIYTTKSHQVIKNDIKCDRFRIIIPFKHNIDISEEMYPFMYENIMDYFDISVYDKQTKNKNRLWFTNPGATIYKNSADLFDPLPFMPDTNAREWIQTQMDSLKTPNSLDKIEKRLYGMKKWFLANTYAETNRNKNLFKFGIFCRDLGVSNWEQEVENMNISLKDPLSDKEVKNIISSIQRR